MDLSGDTSIIGSPLDDYMGSHSGSVYFFFIRDNGTWEEVQKLNPADGKAYDQLGYSVAIYRDTTIIGAKYDEKKSYDSGSGYVYTKVDRKWIGNGKIVPEEGTAYDLMTNLGVVLTFLGVLIYLPPSLM